MPVDMSPRPQSVATAATLAEDVALWKDVVKAQAINASLATPTFKEVRRHDTREVQEAELRNIAGADGQQTPRVLCRLLLK